MNTTRARWIAGLGCALAVGACSNESTSSSTHWVTCARDSDCQNVPGAVGCANGYCVDGNGKPVGAGRVTAVGGMNAGGQPAEGGTTGGGAGGAAGVGGSAVCRVGADQTCNDNPTVSSLYGVCQADGTCLCNDGFTLNPATGRCL